MSKYDWKNIPASIQWIAKDCDGRFYGFNHEPFRNPWGFGINEGFAKRLYISDVQVAWQDSLEQRPKGASHE
ncbi:hypothetical protein [Acinetobacter pittii]|uniref:hypothetical protein n=1 Tax=Acinetobacter pittii TaxID=48296 RepID=UPI001FD636FB|nr:hypothetical protein [Acinetobacter pittii]